MSKKPKKININFNFSLEDILKHHGIFTGPFGFIDKDTNDARDKVLNVETGMFDMDKIESLVDDYVQHKITKKYGNGWMMDDADIGVNISFSYKLKRIIYDEIFELRQELFPEDYEVNERKG